MEEIIAVFLICFIIWLLTVYIFAKQFDTVAKEKGYYDNKYFWLCLLFTFFGYLLVIALPNRGNTKNTVNVADVSTAGNDDELPEL